MISWESGGLTQKNFLQPNCLQCRRMPLYKIGEMERVQYELQFLPLLLPMAEGRGGSCPSSPSRRRPWQFHIFFSNILLQATFLLLTIGTKSLCLKITLFLYKSQYNRGSCWLFLIFPSFLRLYCSYLFVIFPQNLGSCFYKSALIK